MMQLCRVKAVGKISQRDHAPVDSLPGRSKGVPWLIRPMWGRGRQKLSLAEEVVWSKTIEVKLLDA